MIFHKRFTPQECFGKIRALKEISFVSAITATTFAHADVAHVEPNVTDFPRACSQLVRQHISNELHTLRITQADFFGTQPAQNEQPALTDHCDVYGAYGERTGADGQTCSVQFHRRMPLDWNGDLFDELDGCQDGMIHNFRACTLSRVHPEFLHYQTSSDQALSDGAVKDTFAYH